MEAGGGPFGAMGDSPEVPGDSPEVPWNFPEVPGDSPSPPQWGGGWGVGLLL